MHEFKYKITIQILKSAIKKFVIEKFKTNNDTAKYSFLFYISAVMYRICKTLIIFIA